MTLEQLIKKINDAGMVVHNLSQGQNMTWHSMLRERAGHRHDWGSGVTPIDALQRAYDVTLPQITGSLPPGSDLV